MHWVDELDGQPFRVRDGVAAGISAEQLRNPRLSRPYWGVRSIADASTTCDRARAFAVRMPPRAFFMGVTAAALHGLPLPSRPARDPLLHIGVVAGSRRVTANGVTAHHIDVQDSDIQTVEGIRITTIERTWVDLAGSGAIDLAHLVAVGDRLIWRRDRRSTVEQLAAARSRYHGRRGTRLMDVALDLLSDRADSPPESILRVACWQRGLPPPLPNHPILDRQGRFAATPDLSWPDRLVALEYEGDHHRTDREQWHRDLARYALLEDLGWRVVRATASDLRNPSPLLARLERLLTA